MTIASGLGSQLGLAAESTPGTRQTPTRFLEFIEEHFRFHRAPLWRKGLRAGRFLRHAKAQGVGYVDGNFKIELAPQSTALLFKHLLGSDTITGAGPYTHTFGMAVLDALTLTIQVNRPDEGGTDRPWDFIGMQFTAGRLEAKVNEYLYATFDCYGQTEDTTQALAAASYPATWTPFTFVHGALTIAGSAYDVTEIQIDIPTGLRTGRHAIRATNPERPKVSKSQNRREITGRLMSDFFDLTAYNRFKNQTAASLSLVFTSGTNVLTISGNVEFDEPEGPNVTGEEMLTIGLPFSFLHATTDASGFSVVLVNSDAAA